MRPGGLANRRLIVQPETVIAWHRQGFRFILDMEESPLSHPIVERLIGTVRREFLDQVLFWNACDLERKLTEFQTYYNAARSHASLAGYTPFAVATGHTAVPADLNHMRWVSHCRGLVQVPVAT